MFKFLGRFMLFLSPLFLIAILVLIIDPYNYFFPHNFVPDKVKIHVINRSAESMPRGNTLWKYIDFKRHPSKNILIGDSRAFDLNVDTIRKISNLAFYNFGVPGGNYNSIIETFWYITGIIKPGKVYIQTSFHNYSSASSYNLMADARKVCNRPYFFFSRIYFLEESMLDIYYAILGKKSENREEAFNQEKWDKTLMKQGNSSLVSMQYPEKYHEELQKISDYCKANHIELNFIIFPDQQDFHDLITKNALEDTYRKYKSDIFSLGKVYDYDNAGSELIRDRSNYRDIFHLKHDLIYKYIIRGIWSNDTAQ